jgi:hypothetical protein
METWGLSGRNGDAFLDVPPAGVGADGEVRGELGGWNLPCSGSRPPPSTASPSSGLVWPSRSSVGAPTARPARPSQDGLRRHQPDRRADHRSLARPTRPRPLADRGPAPRAGHHPRRGRLAANAPRTMVTWRNLAIGAPPPRRHPERRRRTPGQLPRPETAARPPRPRIITNRTLCDYAEALSGGRGKADPICVDITTVPPHQTTDSPDSDPARQQ